MARIKPQALLIQSKKKKGPTRISVTTIVFANLLLVFFLFCFFGTHRHWFSRSLDQESGSNSFEGTDTMLSSRKFGSGNSNSDDGFGDSKKYDLPGYAMIKTSKGYIGVELFKDGSPEIVDKFLDLCQKGHFKGMGFTHVIKNYVIHGGNPHGLGIAEDWISKEKLRDKLITSPKHEAFMLGTSKAKTDSKVFELFITTAPIPDLSEKLVVFGRVIKGADVVQEIEEVDTDEHYQPKSHIGIIDVTLKREI